MGVYTTVAEVRAEPEVPDAAPPSDADVESLIARAEEQIDAWLGPWPVQTSGPSSGRKIVQADVEAWRWTKLKTATRRLAARLHADLGVLSPPEWDEVQGPDFRTKGHLGAGARLPDVAAALNASGLRRLTAKARA